jgi:serine/threonine protein kinase
MAQPCVLKANTRVGTYAIVEAVDSNSHSVVYRAREEGSAQEYWLQEFIPLELADRVTDRPTVEPLPGQESRFEEALTRFLQEARILSQIRDPYVTRVREYAEAAGTAFLSMELESGVTLETYLERHQDMPQDEICNLFVPLLKGLRVIHSHGLTHRDINPRSVFIRDSGLPLLIGFGSTHRTLPLGNTGLDFRVTPGYSPVEQYGDQGNLGPWTDLYAVGAMMYRCISGNVPVAADQRTATLAGGGPDPLSPAVEVGKGKYDSRILGGIDWLMQPAVKDRPQSVSDVLTTFVGSDEHYPVPEPDLEAPVPPEPQAQEELKLDAPRLYADPRTRVRPQHIPSGSNPLFWIISVGLLAAVGVFTFWPQIKSIVSPPEQKVVVAPSNIEGTTIPADILDRPLPGDAPPDLPESIKFTRKADDFRMDQYRQIDQKDKGVRELLRSANEKIEHDELVGPANKNALASFRAVLLMDEDNVDALQGIDEIGTLLLKRARDSLKSGEVGAASEILQDLEKSGIEVMGIAELRERIDAETTSRAAEEERVKQAKLAEQQRLEQERLAEEEGARREAIAEQERIEEEQRAEQERREEQKRAERERFENERLAEKKLIEEERRVEQERSQQAANENRLNSLLLQAKTITGGRSLTSSSANSALPYYKQALAIDPGNAEAVAGTSRIHRYYVEQANAALALDRFDEVEKFLGLAAKVDADSEVLSLLRQQMQLRQSALASARQQQSSTATAVKSGTEPAQLAALDAKQMEKGIRAYYAGRYETALIILEPLSDRGNTRAQIRLGVMYLRGRGVEQNLDAGMNLIKKAFPNLQVAAVAGEPWAQADMGSLYQTGLLVAKNNTEAVRWYRAAAEQGYAGAQTNLGAMYADGKGVAQSKTEAVKWLRLAAEQGDKVAQDNLSALGIQNLD